MAPIINDINNCSLRQVSWVIPDQAASDHPGNEGYGPSFVANIINAVGESYANSGNKCDYWGDPSHGAVSEPTAIFVTWDDWGGFYDHVTPWAVYTGDNGQNGWECKPPSGGTGAPNGWGCGYTSGFRVPLLVVSELTPAGYISGKCNAPGYPSCGQNAKVAPYMHDFGSILAFTEWNFGMGPIDQSGDNGYADLNAPDNNHPPRNVPLSEFFQGPQRGFTAITPLAGQDASFFLNYYGNPAYGNPVPQGPDDE